MSAGPAVSVIVPTHDRAAVLGRALDSVLAQEHGDFELLVVDDGSSDDTAARVEAIDDARVRLLRQPENRGVAAARNRGLREARADFVAFLDSDDVWLPSKLGRQLAHFRELPDTVGLTCTGCWAVRDGAPVPFAPTHRGRIHSDLLERNVIPGTPGVMIRRSVVERVGGFDESLPAIEDWDYWLRIAERFEVEALPAFLWVHHDQEGRARKSRDLTANLAARARFYRKHERALREHGLAGRFLAQSARRHLLSGHWDPRGARVLLREAMTRDPAAPEVWGLLALSWVPLEGYRWAADLRRRMAGEGGLARSAVS